MADPHHADSHDAYVRGSQEISEQTSTFHAFISMAKWGSLWMAALLMFLVLWFQPGGSFIAGAIAAVAMLVLGYFGLKSPKAKH
ncbi:aa3-type cytochrome c oxidase subunit IV [Brevundimonas sp.]|uniref:aa3-type cytochrome c oxidase subunit IV n=1 Tax=Brevundimonas sp. TaxID=1871086 RepID=UPI002FCA17A9